MSITRTGLDLIARIFTKTINVDRARGYDDVANAARISPLAIIGDDLQLYEGTAVVAETCLNLVTSYYLKALPMSQEIGGAEVIKTLRRLSPDPRSRIDYSKMRKSGSFLPSLLSEDNLTVEDVPTSDFLGFTGQDFSLEADGREKGKALRKDGVSVKGNYLETSTPIEKNVEVTIRTDGSDVVVPITLALSTHFVTRLVTESLFTGSTVRDTFTERYYAMKAGVITTTDFIFALDMIKRKKRLMIEDSSNLMKEITERREAGWAVVAKEGFHLGEATNVGIISSEAAAVIAKRHYGKISSPTVRDKMFSDMSLMVLAVIDREDEFVTFYYRNITASSTHKISNLAKKNKNGGPDIVEVLQALNSNSKPIF